MLAESTDISKDSLINDHNRIGRFVAREGQPILLNAKHGMKPASFLSSSWPGIVNCSCRFTQDPQLVYWMKSETRQSERDRSHHRQLCAAEIDLCSRESQEKRVCFLRPFSRISATPSESVKKTLIPATTY